MKEDKEGGGGIIGKREGIPVNNYGNFTTAFWGHGKITNFCNGIFIFLVLNIYISHWK